MHCIWILLEVLRVLASRMGFLDALRTTTQQKSIFDDIRSVFHTWETVLIRRHLSQHSRYTSTIIQHIVASSFRPRAAWDLSPMHVRSPSTTTLPRWYDDFSGNNHSQNSQMRPLQFRIFFGWTLERNAFASLKSAEQNNVRYASLICSKRNFRWKHTAHFFDRRYVTN